MKSRVITVALEDYEIILVGGSGEDKSLKINSKLLTKIRDY